MRKFTSFSRQLAFAMPFALLPLVAVAQDPVQLAPDIYKVAIDNKDVRVLDIHLKAGGKSPMHSHPAYTAVAITSCKLKFTSPDGKTVDVELNAGDVAWNDAESHSVDNVGTTECHALNIEMKKAAHKTHKAK